MGINKRKKFKPHRMFFNVKNVKTANKETIQMCKAVSLAYTNTKPNTTAPMQTASNTFVPLRSGTISCTALLSMAVTLTLAVLDNVFNSGYLMSQGKPAGNGIGGISDHIFIAEGIIKRIK